MSKIKLSLPSGSEEEKSVISYFNNGGNYLILDAESVGSMGLPIILVSKVVNNKIEKINDQNEWQQVKGYLKNIISGGQTNYLEVPATMNADEVYFTQLTLPVASFDTLKKSYVVPTNGGEVADPTVNPNGADEMIAAPATNDVSGAEGVVSPASPVVEETTMEPVNMTTTQEDNEPTVEPAVESADSSNDEAIANPIIGEEPIANEGLSATVEPVADAVSAVEETPDVASNNTPVVEESVQPVVAETPVVEEPSLDESQSVVTPEEPEITDPIVQNAESTPVIENPTPETPAIEVAEAPVLDNITNTSQNTSGVTNIDEVKQKFMKACEDLFDAIVQIK